MRNDQETVSISCRHKEQHGKSVGISDSGKALLRLSGKKFIDFGLELDDAIEPKSHNRTKASIRIPRRSQPLFDVFNAPTLEANFSEFLSDYNLLLRAKMSPVESMQATTARQPHAELLKQFDERKSKNGVCGNNDEELISMSRPRILSSKLEMKT